MNCDNGSQLFIVMFQLRNIDFFLMVPMVGASHPRWPALCYRELLHLLGSNNPCPTAAVLMEPVLLVFKSSLMLGSTCRLSYVKATLVSIVGLCSYLVQVATVNMKTEYGFYD